MFPISRVVAAGLVPAIPEAMRFTGQNIAVSAKTNGYARFEDFGKYYPKKLPCQIGRERRAFHKLMLLPLLA